MTTLTCTVADSATMLRRNLKRALRYPGLTVIVAAMPIVFLLLFVYVFGGTLGDGITPGGGRGAYVEFLVPGMLLFTVAGAAQITAISVAKDMADGIIARFKTMRIWRPAVLAGHVLGGVILTAASVVVLVVAALLIGYDASGGLTGWLGAVGLLVLLAFALIWLCVGCGLAAKSVETASNTPLVLTLLPFIGSGFVPVDTMPGGLRWFAAHQPFTPVADAIRELLAGRAAGGDAALAVAWCLALAAAGYLWSRRLYDRRPVA